MLLREKHCTPFAQYHSLTLIFVDLARWASWRKVWKFLELVVGSWGIEGAVGFYCHLVAVSWKWRLLAAARPDHRVPRRETSAPVFSSSQTDRGRLLCSHGLTFGKIYKDIFVLFFFLKGPLRLYKLQTPQNQHLPCLSFL